MVQDVEIIGEIISVGDIETIGETLPDKQEKMQKIKETKNNLFKKIDELNDIINEIEKLGFVTNFKWIQSRDRETIVSANIENK